MTYNMHCITFNQISLHYITFHYIAFHLVEFIVTGNCWFDIFNWGTGEEGEEGKELPNDDWLAPVKTTKNGQKCPKRGQTYFWHFLAPLQILYHTLFHSLAVQHMEVKVLLVVGTSNLWRQPLMPVTINTMKCNAM